MFTYRGRRTENLSANLFGRGDSASSGRGSSASSGRGSTAAFKGSSADTGRKRPHKSSGTSTSQREQAGQVSAV